MIADGAVAPSTMTLHHRHIRSMWNNMEKLIRRKKEKTIKLTANLIVEIKIIVNNFLDHQSHYSNSIVLCSGCAALILSFAKR